MLRTICRQFTRQNEFQFARFNSTNEARPKTREIRDVKLIGTVYSNVLTHKDGSKSLLVKTVNSDNFYKVHRAIVRTPTLLDIVGDNLKIGQRIYIGGELQARQFTNEQDLNRQELNIRVKQLFASKLDESAYPDAESQSTQRPQDENNVSILAFIISDISHTEKISAFSVGTHGLLKDGTEKFDVFRVWAHDEGVINMLKNNNVQRKDRVFINGFLNYKPEVDKEGQKRRSGFVEATNILKVDRLQELPDKNAVAAN